LNGARAKRGFTIIEVVTVVMIVSIVTRIAVPQMQEVLTRARATEIRASFRVVEEAATRLSVENNPWPEDALAGIVPEPLVEKLPEGFSFDRERYQLDWENWTLPGGMPNDPTIRGLIGISITTSDRALGMALMDVIPLNAKFSLGETYTFIFATQ
jgi:prepilin-type N-terminal cleavage/methylation domain-containing protein